LCSPLQDARYIDARRSNFNIAGQNQYNIQHADFRYTLEEDSVLASLKPVTNFRCCGDDDARSITTIVLYELESVEEEHED
jgi:hypothetical protein